MLLVVLHTAAQTLFEWAIVGLLLLGTIIALLLSQHTLWCAAGASSARRANARRRAHRCLGCSGALVCC